MPSPRAHGSLGPLLCLATLATACFSDPVAGEDTETAGSDAKYQATIRRTSYGVAHITAADIGGAGFGQGYAFAQDHACVLADQIVKVRSERAMFFGAGPDDAHVNSDFGYLALGVMKRAEAALPEQPADIRALIEGYAAGYNQYLMDTGVDAIPGTCRGQAWVRPITATDLYAYYLDLGLLASGNALLSYIATAQPPGAALRVPGGPIEGLSPRRVEALGSNGWAVGRGRSASGAGMVVANPHFPWEGELKLWESHVTVPDVLDVYGVGLMGVPGALIGFNRDIGWTHTFSSGQRFTIYSLTLVDGDPTSYMFDGEPRKMSSREHTIKVRQGDGSLKEQGRTLYASHHGPIINVDPFIWDNSVALAYRDANIENTGMIAQFFGMNRARSLAEFKQVFADVSGIPWVNTMAADAAGATWYIDAAATPRLSQAAIDGWLASVGDDGTFLPKALYQQGLVLLDGSSSVNDWTDAPGARSPGVVPFKEQPQLDREDFVFNANDSYWLSNPVAPLEGFSPLHGFERVAQSPRTRMNIRLLTEVRADGASGADGKFTVDELQAAIMGNRSYTAELLRAAMVERCTTTAKVPLDDAIVDLGPACAALAGWDGRFDPDSVGAVVWREFLGSYAFESLEGYGPLFAVDFDPDNPVETPHTLPPAPEVPEEDKALAGLAKAVVRLRDAGIAVDAPLSAVQHGWRGNKPYSLPGGQSRDGTTNIVTYSVFKTTLDPSTMRGELINPATGLTADGYVVNFGSSFVMALEIGADGPKGRAFLTYSQSDDPTSPHFIDQTALFSTQQWRPLLFTAADIAADPQLRVLEVAGGE